MRRASAAWRPETAWRLVRIACGIWLTLIFNNAAAIWACDQDGYVTVHASAPAIAEEGGIAAQFVFMVDMAAGSNTDLTLQISGTATNGTDYQTLPIHVTIPSLQTQAVLALTPIPDAAAEPAETVTVAIVAVDNPCVHFGANSSATVALVDGHDLQWDVFWRNSDGTNALWQFTATASGQFTSAFPPGVSTDWQAKGLGDVNADGTTDVVWLHPATGTVAVWLMRTPTTVHSVSFPASIGPASNWSWSGIGDANGDGRADLFWRNTDTGQLRVWHMSATGTIASVTDYGDVPLEYELRDVRDFNADGVADLLWFRPLDGLVVLWLLKPDGGVTAAFPGAVGPGSWRPYAAGDLDGDGAGDIFWRNEATGMTAAWYLDGGAVADFDFFVSVPVADWQLGTAADQDADGRADLMWYAPSTGSVARWLMKGRHASPVAEALPGIGPGWQMVE